jgi:hypothetical protein
MTRDEAVVEILQELSYRRGGEAEVITQLQRSQNDLEKPGRTLPYFLRAVDQTIETVVDQDYVLLPTGFIKEIEDAPLRYSDADGNPSLRYLEKSDDRALREYYTTDPSTAVVTGGPAGYTLLPDRIRIFPTADAVYTLYWDFYKQADSLATNIENSWLANNPNILIGHCGYRLAKRKRDAEAAGVFQGLYNDGLRQLIGDNEERDWSNRDYYMGARS